MSSQLSINNGPAVSLESLGITGASLEITSAGMDQLRLIVDGRIDSPPIIGSFQKVSLIDSGSVRFVGWRDLHPRRASGNEEAMEYIITGPARWLHRHIPADDAQTAGIRYIGAPAENEAPPLPIDTVIRGILNEAIARYPDRFQYTDADLDAAVFQSQIPVEKRTDNTSWDLLRFVLRYVPTVTPYWDYSTTPPTLRFTDTAPASVFATLSEAGYAVLSGSIIPMEDQLYDVVQVAWVRDNAVSRVDTIPSGGEAAALGADRTYRISLQSDVRYSLPASGIAAGIAAHVQKLHVNAEAELGGINWTHRPGQKWAFGGRFSHTATSIAYSVSRDLFTRIQNLTLGIPPNAAVIPLGQRNSDDSRDDNNDNGGGEEETATVTRTIVDPQDEAIPGAYFLVAGQAYPSGSTATITPGDVTVFFWVPPDYVPPETEELELGPNDVDESTVTATWRDRLRLRRADGQEGEEIDLNVSDIPSDKGTAKLQEYHVTINGELKLTKILALPPYDPPA